MALSPERKKLLDRIAALLAVAESTTFDAEAETARALAMRLMAEHNIRQGEAAAAGRDAFEYRRIEAFFLYDVWWDRIIKFSLAKLNNCFPSMSATAKIGKDGKVSGGGRVTHFNYCGRSSDLDAFEYMYGIVLRQRTKAWNDYAARGGGETKGQWLYGYARGLEDKIDKILDELNDRMRGQGNNQLAPLSLYEQAKLWHIEHIGPLGKSLSDPGGGARDGYSAGGNVNLYRGEVGQTRRVRQVRRITHQK
jgi:hypothetical protein